MLNNKILTTALRLTMLIAVISIAACKSAAPAPVPPGPIHGTVINSDSIVTVKIQTVTKQSTGYPWTLDVLVQNTVDVNNLPNPVKDSVGKVITVQTDQDMTSFKVNDVVTAKIKYVGDAVIQAGISLYMYDVAPEIKP